MVQRYHHGALRTALLDAAEAILDADGISGLTLRAVARRAGVSHAAPSHHFGDLSGLLSALATAGFVRLRDRLEADVDHAGADPSARLIALGRAYIGFALAHPGLFQLMFRAERLDWSAPDLPVAGAAAFALLSLDEPPPGSDPADARRRFTMAAARWSLVHGLATLLIDGRLGPMVDKAGADLEAVIDTVLAGLVTQERALA